MKRFDRLYQLIIENTSSTSKEDRIKALSNLQAIKGWEYIPQDRWKGLTWEEIEGEIIESHHYETLLDGYDYDGEPLYRTGFIFKLLTPDHEEVYGHVTFNGNYNHIREGWDIDSIDELTPRMYARLVNKVR